MTALASALASGNIEALSDLNDNAIRTLRADAAAGRGNLRPETLDLAIALERDLLRAARAHGYCSNRAEYLRFPRASMYEDGPRFGLTRRERLHIYTYLETRAAIRRLERAA